MPPALNCFRKVVIMKEKKDFIFFDRIGLAVFLILCLMGLVQIWKYLGLSIASMALTAILLEALFMLVSWAAWEGRMPFLLLAVTLLLVLVGFKKTFFWPLQRGAWC